MLQRCNVCLDLFCFASFGRQLCLSTEHEWYSLLTYHLHLLLPDRFVSKTSSSHHLRIPFISLTPSNHLSIPPPFIPLPHSFQCMGEFPYSVFAAFRPISVNYLVLFASPYILSSLTDPPTSFYILKNSKCMNSLWFLLYQLIQKFPSSRLLNPLAPVHTICYNPGYHDSIFKSVEVLFILISWRIQKFSLPCLPLPRLSSLTDLRKKPIHTDTPRPLGVMVAADRGHLCPYL